MRKKIPLDFFCVFYFTQKHSLGGGERLWEKGSFVRKRKRMRKKKEKEKEKEKEKKKEKERKEKKTFLSFVQKEEKRSSWPFHFLCLLASFFSSFFLPLSSFLFLLSSFPTPKLKRQQQETSQIVSI